MALTKTSIAAALGVNDSRMTATAATGATVGGIAIIDGEYAFISAISGTAIDLTRRGSFGTLVKAHVILAPLTFGLTSDIPDYAPGTTIPKPPTDYWQQRAVSVNSTFDPGTETLTGNTEVLITKATAWTQTITGPSNAQDGLMLRFISDTAAAHVITYTAGFNGDTTASDIATFAATKGNSITLRAQSGRWGIVAKDGVTVA